MRIHHQNLSNAFVLECDLGETPVWQIDCGETQIYPDTATGVTRAMLTTPEPGTLDWAYWVHAIAQARKTCSSTCTMRMTLGGKSYRLFSTYDTLPAVSLSRDGIMTFPEGHLPTLQDIASGAIVTISATIPKHSAGSMHYEADGNHMVTDLPWLPDSYIHAGLNKGQKKVSAGCNIWLQGVPSGVNHIQAHLQQDGHGRGYREFDVLPEIGRVSDGAVNEAENSYQPGDTHLDFRVTSHNRTGGDVELFFPAFTRTFNIKMAGVIYAQAAT